MKRYILILSLIFIILAILYFMSISSKSKQITPTQREPQATSKTTLCLEEIDKISQKEFEKSDQFDKLRSLGDYKEYIFQKCLEN